MNNNLLNLSDLTALISNPSTPPETRNQAIKLKEDQITTIKAEIKAKLQQMMLLRGARIQTILNSQVDDATKDAQIAVVKAVVERVNSSLEEHFTSKGVGEWKELLEEAG